MRCAAIVLGLLGLGCTVSQPPDAGDGDKPASAPSAPTAPDATRPPQADAPPSVAPPEAERGDPVLIVTDVAALTRLEEAGMALGPLVFGGGSGQISTFSGDAGYKSIRRKLERDLKQRFAGDDKAGVGLRFQHRAYDAEWLSSDKTRLELTAVVNRIDRRAFDNGSGRCGEVRFIYRLAYETTIQETAVDSRLPMTVNVVFWQPGDDCQAVARRWFVPPKTAGVAMADALLAGPLAAANLSTENLEAVEVNLQMLRWPAVLHPSLGGNTEYELRVFKRDEGVYDGPFHPTPLENTPDVERIAKRPALQKQLREWIADNLAGLEEGTAVLPDALSSDVSVSVTPRALGRLANRPFSQLLRTADFDALALSEYEHIGSPAALLRRLDTMSCQGCHATRSVAGFHVVGAPRNPDLKLDQVLVPTSAHLHGDLPRRQAYLLALTDGTPVDETRPFPDFEPTRGYGALCGLGDPGVAKRTCTDGLECVAMDDTLLGTCLPPGHGGVGDPCELGKLRTNAVGYKDRVRGAEISECDGSQVCNINKMGFPGGMCTDSAAGVGSGGAKGPIVDFTAFNNCVGRRRPFPRCIEEAAHAVGLRACDETNRCRDDYVCARSPYEDAGVCLPPYFLFQLRVDGHVM